MKIAYFLFPALLIFVGQAQAQTLTLTQQYEHAGLTFSSPLSFIQAPTSIRPINLEFGTSEKISIKSTAKAEAKERSKGRDKDILLKEMKRLDQVL